MLYEPKFASISAKYGYNSRSFRYTVMQLTQILWHHQRSLKAIKANLQLISLSSESWFCGVVFEKIAVQFSSRYFEDFLKNKKWWVRGEWRTSS